MGFDEQRYRDDVLEPGRIGEIQLADLFVRYGIVNGTSPDEAEFAAQVDAVAACWESLSADDRWKILVDPLRIEHEQLKAAGALTPAAFNERRAKARAEALAKLRARAGLVNATHCGPRLVAKLRGEIGGVTEQDVIGALAEAGVKASRLPVLPAREPVDYLALSAALTALGLRFSADVVFGADAVRAGFSLLDGFRLAETEVRLDHAAVTAARGRADRMARQNAETEHVDFVVSVVKCALDDGVDGQLLLWEVVQPLRERADGLTSQRELAAQACELGLNREEAGLLAAAVIEEGSTKTGQAAKPPPAPGRARAVPSDGCVRLSWSASTSRTGQVVYRVVRKVGEAPAAPDDGTLIAAQTQVTYAEDRHPPPGVRLNYAIFAGRLARSEVGEHGPRWSAPAVTEGIVIAPPVSGLRLEQAGPSSVRGTWTAPPEAAGVRVVRASEGREIPVDSGPAGFTDAGLTPGVEYRYLITADYLTGDGARYASDPLAGPIGLPPAPVETMRIEETGERVRVSCISPPAGAVRFYLSDLPPPWRWQAELGQAELAELGEPAAERQDTPGREMTAEFTPLPGEHYLIAVTSAGNFSVLGASARFGRIDAVSGLIAERLTAGPAKPGEARLGWIWPVGAASAIVSWPGGARRYSRHEYHADGGAVIPVGPGEVTFEVAAVHADSDGEHRAAPVSVTLPAELSKAGYRWRRDHWYRRADWMLELTAEQDCELPELVIVRAAAFPPGAPADGVVVGRLAPAKIGPANPVSHAVTVPRDWAGFLACFVADEADGELLLFQPPPSELRIR